jgi:hypothetical protein
MDTLNAAILFLRLQNASKTIIYLAFANCGIDKVHTMYLANTARPTSSISFPIDIGFLC